MHRDETTAREHGRNFYRAEPFVCHACAARDMASTAWHESKSETAGLYWTVKGR